MSSKLKVNNIIPSTGTQIGISTTGGGINLLTGTVVTGVITATRFDGIISATTDDWITHQGDSNTRMGFPDTDTFKVETAGNQRLHITSAGKVGIGIDPTARLHVNGLSSDTAIILARAADTNGNSIINILSEGTTGSSRIVFSDTAAATGDAWISYGHSRRELTFTTAGTSNNRLTLDSSGRCLIGVASSMLTSPRLQVYQASSGSGAQILIRGDGNSFCEASVLGQVNASVRGSGWYAHDRANNNEWFWGRPYSNNDQFIIARKASPSVPGQDTAQTANSIMKVHSNGNVTIDDGNLIIGTAGHGIDFSATGDPTNGASTSELLDYYEEGTFTPAFGGLSSVSYSTQFGKYTRIGRQVFCTAVIDATGIDESNNITLTGLPYSSTDSSDNQQRSTWLLAYGGHITGVSDATARFRSAGSSWQGVKGTASTTYLTGAQLSSSGTVNITGSFSYYVA